MLKTSLSHLFLTPSHFFNTHKGAILSLNDHKFDNFDPLFSNSGEIFSNVPLLTEKSLFLVDFVPLFSFNRLTPMLLSPTASI